MSLIGCWTATRRQDGQTARVLSGMPRSTPDYVSGRGVGEAIGDAGLITTTDYPHGDAKYPNAMPRFLHRDLHSESKRQSSWDTTMRVQAL